MAAAGAPRPRLTVGPAAERAGALGARLRQHLLESALIRPGDTLAVALSGGLDSVVLLHLLRFPLRDLDLRLSALHVDHGMRPGSALDALWVRGLCRAWGVEAGFARLESPPASEAEARHERYARLEELAPPGATIATAHHLDDQAETVLLRLARGTGIRGLRGIAPRRGRVVRPLLPFGRADLEHYAAAHGLPWREDATNRSLRFARNRVRHRVLPALEELRPGAARRLAALANAARREEAAWDDALDRLEKDLILEADDEGLSLARPLLHSYHPHLRARVVRHLLRRYGTPPGRAGTRAALEFISTGSSGGVLHLPGNIRLQRDFDRIRITRERDVAAEPDRPVRIPGPSAGSGDAVIGGRRLRLRWRWEADDGPGAAAPGGDAAGERAVVMQPRFPLQLRGWNPGDRIRFGYGSKKLKKLLAEHRLDRRARRSAPILVDADGRVLWVVGVARAEGVGVAGHGLEIVATDAG